MFYYHYNTFYRYCEENPHETFAIYQDNLKAKNIIDSEGNFIKGALKDHKKLLAREFRNVFG